MSVWDIDETNNNKINLSNFDLNNFKKQPCGKDILDEYGIGAKDENQEENKHKYDDINIKEA